MKQRATFKLPCKLFFLIILMVGCTAPLIPTATELPPAVIHVNSPTETSEPTGESPLIAEKIPTEYEFDALFNYVIHNLSVQETITFTNNSRDAITELRLVVEAKRVGANFSLTALKSISGPSISEAEFNGSVMRVPLGTPLTRGDIIQLQLDYELALPAGAGTLSWTDRQTNLIDWYPYLPPYIDGQGWLIHEAAPVGEHEVFESANFQVRIEVINAPASLQIAAPAPAEKDGNSFSYELQNARRFAWSASGQYEVRDTESLGIPITAYYFNEHRDAAKASLETAKKAVEIYSNLFGSYPYDSLAIVDAQFFDGMESDGIFFLDQSYFLEYNYSPRNYLTALTAHEVAHNWWFGQVGNDQALEPWLDEALCIYSEMLYYENTYPEMVPWWWEFRINRFHPTGWVNSSIYEHSGFDSYVQAVYMRGAQFLEALRNGIGEGAFFGFLRNYMEYERGLIANRIVFFDLFKHYSQANIDPIVEEFFSE